MASLEKSIVVFDGTTHFVESWSYRCQDGEVVVFRGSFDLCSQKCDQFNAECCEKRR